MVASYFKHNDKIPLSSDEGTFEKIQVSVFKCVEFSSFTGSGVAKLVEAPD